MPNANLKLMQRRAFRLMASLGLSKSAVNPPRHLPIMPPEMWDFVFSHLHEKAELRQVRLVCLGFSDLAACRLFEDLSFTLHTASIDKLINVASHESLRVHVKHLEFRTVFLPFFSGVLDWARAFWTDDCPYQQASMTSFIKHCMRFPIYCNEQKYPIAFAQNLAGHAESPTHGREADFVQAMLKFSNLRGMDITTNTPTLHEPVLVKWGGLQCEMEFSPAMAADINEQTSCVLYALGHRNRHADNFNSLEMANWDWAYWKPESLRDLWNRLEKPHPRCNVYPTYHSVLKDSFKHLSSLHLTMTSCCTRNASSVAHCAAFLRTATNLTDLNLEINEGQRPFFFFLPHDDGHVIEPWQGEHSWNVLAHLQQVEWPKLRTLSLSVASSEKYVVGLLERVRPTLQHLSLTTCHLFGRWAYVFRHLREDFSLRRVRLHHLVEFHGNIGDSWDDVEGTDADNAISPKLFRCSDLAMYSKRFQPADVDALRDIMGKVEPECLCFIRSLLEAHNDHVVSYILNETDEELILCPWMYYMDLSQDFLASDMAENEDCWSQVKQASADIAFWLRALA